MRYMLQNVTQMPPVNAANLVTNSGNTAYGVDVITIGWLIAWLAYWYAKNVFKCVSLFRWIDLYVLGIGLILEYRL